MLALVVLVATTRWERRARVPLLSRWLLMEQAAHAVAVRPVLALSQALAVFDDQIVDGSVERVARRVRSVSGALARGDDGVLDGAVVGTARATTSAARASARFDLGGLDGTVAAVTRLVARGGAGARRLQTGQLHQYYGQAAAVLAVSTLLLLLMR